jgi:concanavalin A-like lectin/glucanase superfamily protein/VanZ like protein
MNAGDKGKRLDKAIGWARLTAVSGLFLILAATLFPYHFLPRDQIRFTSLLRGSRGIQARGNSLLIGVDGAFGQPLNGKIDEVRIYRRTLSQADIQRDLDTASPTLPVPAGLVAAYSFDEGAGNSVTDSTHNSSKGNLINGPMWTMGRIGGGVDFNGVNQYVEVQNSPFIDISGTNITLSFWVNIARDGKNSLGDQVILAKPWHSNSMAEPFYQYAVEFGATTQTLNFYFGDMSGTRRGPYECPIRLGEWSHVAFTYDGAEVRGYVNGQEKLSAPVIRNGPIGFDILANVLLYMPLGFGLGCIAHQRRSRQATAVMTGLIIGFALSAIIEALQIALPTRVPSVIDVMSNSLGTMLGSLAAFFGGGRPFEELGNQLQESLSVVPTSKWATIFLGYATLTLLLSAKLQHAATLGTWHKASTLILGNDHSGNRPWEGQITQLEVANKAFDGSLENKFLGKTLSNVLGGWVASYDLRAEGPYKERSGSLPALSWKGKMPLRSAGEIVVTTRTAWLESEAPMGRLVEEIMKANQFALKIGCTPAAHSRPGRILSLSKDHDDLDFEMGQEGANLVLNLRTPITGVNGRQPELVVHDVFPNASLHDLVVTFDGSKLQVYVDGLLRPESLDLNPGTALAAKLFRIRPEEMKGFGRMYYGMVFLPLGCIWGLLSRSNRRWPFTAFLFVSVGFLMSAILEVTLMGIRGGALNTGNLLVGTFLIIGSGWVLHHLIGTFNHGHLGRPQGLDQSDVEIG